MSEPSLSFLCAAVTAALLDYYHFQKPPISVRDILHTPPPDLARDISLAEVLPFGEALWMRTHLGQGCVFVNPGLPEPQKRFAMACALFTALSASPGGTALGFPAVPNEHLREQQDLFARHLLIPTELLPRLWPVLTAQEVASIFDVPPALAAARLQDLAALPSE
jgi:hypothetical protein